jgi:hypothetical protein
VFDQILTLNGLSASHFTNEDPDEPQASGDDRQGDVTQEPEGTIGLLLHNDSPCSGGSLYSVKYTRIAGKN